MGLSNLLAGGCTLAEATLDTEAALKVVLAGPLPPNPAELLSGSKLVSMLTVAAERYDQVILDGPPVLGLADAPILANAADGTLLVVNSEDQDQRRAGRTQAPAGWRAHGSSARCCRNTMRRPQVTGMATATITSLITPTAASPG